MWLDILIAAGVMLAAGVILGLLLALAADKLSVKVDPRLETVVNMLPGLNCGLCGHPGCAGMAGALLDGTDKKVSGCKPSNATQRQQIAEYINSTPDADGKLIKVEP